jgi:hypothetical protein
MKHIVRIFVLVLVVTGAAATSQTTSTSVKNNKVITARTSMLPVPTCAPNDPNACGMGHGR